MTGITTGQTSLPTATDSDDNEVFLTGPLTTALQMLANLFESVTGHDHTGAGKGKPIGSGGIAAGAVVATQRSRAVGATGGPTSASVTYVDLTDLAITLTTTGGDLFCWTVCDFSNSLAGAYDYLALSLDAAVEVAEQVHNMTTANAIYSVSTGWLFTGVGAGAHTVKARWHVDSGTGTANGVRRQLIVVELKL